MTLNRGRGMTTYVIGYDIHSFEDRNHSGLVDAIKDCGMWWHHLNAIWIVVSDLTAAQITDKLKVHLKREDELLVVQSARAGAWTGFKDDGSQWLMEHL